jgi:hypothetical protein
MKAHPKLQAVAFSLLSFRIFLVEKDTAMNFRSVEDRSS